MIQTHVLLYLMEKEAMSSLRRGRLVGWSISHFQETYGIPKSTFYRHINQMIEQGMITKQKRGYYTISGYVRSVANGCKVASEITR